MGNINTIFNINYQQYLIWFKHESIKKEWNPDNIDNGTE